MTRKDVQELLAAIEAYFPNASIPNPTYTTNAWASALVMYPKDEVFGALRVYAMTETRGFPPSLGQLLACIKTDIPSWDEVVFMIRRAVQNGIYGSKSEFDAMPPVVQKMIGSPNTIREWAVMDVSAFESYKMPQIRRVYDAVVEREKKSRAEQTQVNCDRLLTAGQTQYIAQLEV